MAVLSSPEIFADSNDELASLLQALDEFALRFPGRVVYRILRDGGLETETITFAELRQRALRVAHHLTSLGVSGERAILLYQQGIPFIVTFFGCLYAGVIAVPASATNRKRGVDIVRRVADDCGATLLLTTGDIFEDFQDAAKRDPTLAGLTVLDTELITDGRGLPAVPLPAGDAVALVQFTAGTSGVPRGVVVTHANLVHNHRQIALSLDTTATTVYMSWLPMFHDMGLGIALQAVWQGVPCVLMSPQSFMLEPKRWLAAISRYRATSSGGPDFAFEHCVRRIRPDDCQDLDLSCWRVAYNGSEPVRASTIERFSNAFGAVGFRREAFHPVYGLAEATLLATSDPPHESPLVRHFSAADLERGEARPVEPHLGRTLVSCGRPWLDASMAIVDPTSLRETEPCHVGEIWLQSPSVAAGYWDREAETKATFLATTPGRAGAFLRTGDLGFIDDDGRLYVTGRVRDSIVVEGRTLYPHEIEATVSACHLALAPQGSAAFLLPSEQGPGLVLLQELTRRALRQFDGQEIVDAIRSAMATGHALEAAAVVLLRPATLPRTTSGKVRRSACRTALTEEALQVVFRWSAAD